MQGDIALRPKVAEVSAVPEMPLGPLSYIITQPTHTLAGQEPRPPRAEEREAGPSGIAHFGEGSSDSSLGCPLCTGLPLGLVK